MCTYMYKDKNCTYKATEKQEARDTQKVKGKDKVCIEAKWSIWPALQVFQ